MTASILNTSGPTGYATDPSKPSGLTGAGWIVIVTTIFYDATSVASSSGFSLVVSVGQSGGGGSGGTAVSVLRRYYSDLTTAASTFPVSVSGAGGDDISFCYALADVDSTTPVPASGTQTATNATGSGTLSVSGASVARDSSLLIIGCGSWNTDIWNNSSPSGFTRDSGSSSSECGGYHATALQNTGTSAGASFSGTAGANEDVCCLVIFQPPASSAQPANSQFFAAASG